MRGDRSSSIGAFLITGPPRRIRPPRRINHSILGLREHLLQLTDELHRDGTPEQRNLYRVMDAAADLAVHALVGQEHRSCCLRFDTSLRCIAEAPTTLVATQRCWQDGRASSWWAWLSIPRGENDQELLPKGWQRQFERLLGAHQLRCDYAPERPDDPPPLRGDARLLAWTGTVVEISLGASH